MFSIFVFSTHKHCITSKVVPDKARLPLGPSWGSSGSVIKPSGRRFKNFKSKFADALFSLSAVLD